MIELLMVVAIIAVLASIAMPQFAKYRYKAYNAAAQADLKNTKSALESYHMDHKYFPY